MMQRGFGWSVDADRNAIVIGSYQELPASAHDGRSSFEYRSGLFVIEPSEIRDGDPKAYAVEVKLPPALDVYGFSVALTDDHIAFGYRTETDMGVWRGGVGLLNRHRLDGPVTLVSLDDNHADQDFGISLDAAGNNLLIGAPGLGDRGGAYLLTTSDPTDLRPIMTEGIPNSGVIGTSVALAGNRAFVTGPSTIYPFVTAVFDFDHHRVGLLQTRIIPAGGRVSANNALAVISPVHLSAIPAFEAETSHSIYRVTNSNITEYATRQWANRENLGQLVATASIGPDYIASGEVIPGFSGQVWVQDVPADSFPETPGKGNETK